MAEPLRKPGSEPETQTHAPFLLDRRPVAASELLARSWTWIESAVFTLYAVVVGLGITWHEPWADEAQAWLLARDEGFWHLLLHDVRYEGTPGLWHAFLWILARLHVGYTGMHWISGAIAAVGVVILLRYSPFPLVLRLLLPFGFWLAYQNAVVARSYVLFAAFAFWAAAMFRDMLWGAISKRRLVWFAVALGLMANLSIHGFVASVGFGLACIALLRRTRPLIRLRWRTAAITLGLFWLFAIVTAFPPSDVSFVAGRNLESSIAKIKITLGDHSGKTLAAAHASPNDDVRPGELAAIELPKDHWTPAQSLWHRIARILALLTYPVSNFRWLALAVCLFAIVQAALFRASPGPLGWLGLLPWLLMVAVFTTMYLAPRHAGMLWVAFLASLWITWPAEKLTSGRGLGLRRVFVALLVLVALDQAWWTAHTVWSDIHQPYSGDVAMARFLSAQPAGTRIAGFYYHTIGTAAFFSHPIYFNQPHAYWLWSRDVRINPTAPATIATHPDVIVISGLDWSANNANISDDWVRPDLSKPRRIPLQDYYGILPYAQAHGYRITHRFCGRSFIRDGYAEELCQTALQPAH